MTAPGPESTKPARTGPLTYILTGAGALLLAAVAYTFWGTFLLAPVPSVQVFFEFYLGWVLAAVFGLAGVVILAIGIVAAGVRLAMRSSGWPSA
jgi:hypothetical protein